MGMDLRLMFGRRENWGNRDFTFRTQIETDRDSQFQEVFRKARSEVVPLGAKIFEFCYGAADGHVLKKDKYGTEFSFTTAGVLKELEFSTAISKWNESIVAFIKSIPDDTIILLGWH